MVRAGQQRAGGRERPGAVRSKVHVRLPKGMRDRPTCAHDAGWGDRRFGMAPRLFDNRWMHVCRNKRGPLAMAGGRMAFSHEITRLPGGGVIRSPCHRWLPSVDVFEAVAQRPARPTVSREIAGWPPAAFGSSPVGFVRLL